MRRVLPLVALLALAGCGGGETAQPAASPSFDPKPALIEACQRAVKAELKAPATAQFSNEVVEQKTEQQWQVLGTVDSQNGFGALLRNSYLCPANLSAGVFTVGDITFMKG